MKRSFIFSFFGLLLLAGTVAAATKDDIQFPIAELGGCANEDACFAYCEEAANFEACYAFGTANGLVDEDEINPELIKTLKEGGGPGGCTSHIACEAYCSDANHLVECVTFAEESGLMSGEELEEAKKVMAAVEAGATLPGGCTGKDSCESYCQEPSHMEECLAFAEAAGFMSAEELEQARTVLPLMQSGQTPGGCTSESTCKAYCESGDHLDECVDFGVKTGFMTQEEADQIKAFGAGMMGGPGGCKGQAECEAYCKDSAHTQECLEFSGGKMMGEFDEQGPGEGFAGPGGCTSKEECETYCQANPEACGGMMGGQEGLKGLEGQEQPEGLEGFMPPSEAGCSTPEECMKLYGDGTIEKFEGEEGYTGYEGYIDSEGFGKDTTHEDPRDLEQNWQTDQDQSKQEIQPQWTGNEFKDVPPQFEVSPESLFITPSTETPSFDGGGGESAGSEPHSLINQPNATFVESVKIFFRNVLSQ